MAKINKIDLDYFFSNDLHLPSRTLYVGGYVSDDMTAGVVKSLKILDEAAKEPIHIIMNSPGGDLTESLAIYDFIKNCRNYVTITVYGTCASGATLILQAADERILSENSSFLVHYGSDGFRGSHVDFIKNAKESARLRRLMEELYLDKIRQKQPNFKTRQIREMLKSDAYYSAHEVLDLGLADKVLGQNDKSGE